MSTTPEGVTQQVRSLPQNEQVDRFQNLFDQGALNDTDTSERRFEKPDEPRTRVENPAELEERKQAEQPAVEPEPQIEEPEYGSLDEFLTAQKIDPTSVQTLPVRVKIDGQERLVPLAEVLKNYQLDAHVTQRSQAVAEAQKQFETEREAAIGLYRQQLTQAKALGDLAQAQLMGEFQQINWTDLRTRDPVQWTALQLEFNNRSAAINQHLREVAAAQEAQERQLREQQAQLLPKEREKMLEARPEWRDAAKFDSDRKSMSSYAKNLGFTDAELSAIADHRYMQVLHDAASYRALQASNPETLKRVRAAPTMARQARMLTNWMKKCFMKFFIGTGLLNWPLAGVARAAWHPGWSAGSRCPRGDCARDSPPSRWAAAACCRRSRRSRPRRPSSGLLPAP